MLRKVCMYISMIYLFMLGLAYLVVPNFEMHFSYYLVIALLMVYFFVNLYTRKPTTDLTTDQVGYTCGAFYFAMVNIFVVMDVYATPNNPAMWAPLAMIVFPMVYIDRMYKYGVEEIIIVIIMGVQSFFHKDFSVFRLDMHVILAAYIISMISAHIILEMRSKEGLAMMELKRISSLDKLTHVLNKDALIQRMENYFLQREANSYCAMLIVDLDDFKQVNDNLGHNTGDMLLERVGQLLKESFRAYDIIGRYGGDEFVVLMPNMKDLSILEMRCRTLQMFLMDFCVGNGQPFTVSIGAIIDQGGMQWQKVFNMADDALYVSKLSGKSCCTTWVVEQKPMDERPIAVVVTNGAHPGLSRLYRGESEKFNILVSTSENEVLRNMSQYHSQIKILFLEMDAINNFGLVLRYLRNRESFFNIPILAVASSEDDAKAAKELGADEVVMKSASDELYKAAMKRLVRM